MDDLIEFLLELVFDIGEAAAESSRTPRWLRRLLMWVFGIFAAAVILGITVFGILTIPEEPVLGIILLVLGLVLLFFGIRRIRKHRRSREDAALDPPCAQKPDRG